MQNVINGIILFIRFVCKFLVGVALSVIGFCFIVSLIMVGGGTSTTSEPAPPVEVIFDIPSYSKITEQELVNRLGEPKFKEEWVYKISKGEFPLVSYDYSIGDFLYTFHTHDGVVVKMYAEIDVLDRALPYEGGYEHIFKQFGITPKSPLYPSVDTGVTLKFDNPAEGIERFEIHSHDPANKTFKMVRATFDMRYFN